MGAFTGTGNGAHLVEAYDYKAPLIETAIRCGSTGKSARLNSHRDVPTHRCRHLGLIFLAPMSVCQGVRPWV